MKTLNNKVILEPYKGVRKLESQVKNGFATTKQKTNLVGLKVIVDGTVSQGQGVIEIKKGQTVYYPEEILYNQKWSKDIYTCKDIGEPFILAEAAYIVLIK